MKLAGKRAVVTGASQGLGQSIATLFAKEGADVLICARNAARRAAVFAAGAACEGHALRVAEDRFELGDTLLARARRRACGLHCRPLHRAPCRAFHVRRSLASSDAILSL